KTNEKLTSARRWGWFMKLVTSLLASQGASAPYNRGDLWRNVFWTSLPSRDLSRDDQCA
ncbi:hypothetical protein NDU88_007164, partial [Pleurodeles waltl]